MCKNNIKLIYLTFIHCTSKFETDKQGENKQTTEPYKR